MPQMRNNRDSALKHVKSKAEVTWSTGHELPARAKGCCQCVVSSYEVHHRFSAVFY